MHNLELPKYSYCIVSKNYLLPQYFFATTTPCFMLTKKKQIFVRTGFESAFFRKHFQYWIKQMSKALIILHFPPYNRYCLHLCIKNKCIYFGSKTRFSIIMLRWTVPKSAMHLCNFGIWICISTSWSVYINTVVQYGSLGTRFYPGNIWVDFILIQKRKKNN